MTLLQYSLYGRETGDAGGKAKRDACEIALHMGFTPSYLPSERRFLRIAQQLLSLRRFQGEKLIFFQYPAVSRQLMNLFHSVRGKNTFTIALLHDLMSLQGDAPCSRESEKKYLNYFDCIIVHNAAMKSYVSNIGYKGKIVILELFDYLHDAQREVVDAPFSNTISFAGNLSKAKFLTELDRVKKCNFLLYGNSNGIMMDKGCNTVYKSVLPSDTIPYLLEGDYGLVWDGDSVLSCTGKHGQYLLYNNPHKLSLYLAAGKPVIVWSKSAVCDFVIGNNVGIAIDSLTDLAEIDLQNGYEEKRENVRKIKRDIADGGYLERALKSAMRYGGYIQ